MIENRAISSIQSRMDKGENTFIFYGGYINDWFLYDLYHGVMSLKEAYKRFFLLEKQFDYFIWYKNSDIEIYTIENDEIVKTNEMTAGKISSNSALYALSKNAQSNKNDTSSNKPTSAEQAAENEGSADKAAFKKTIKHCKENPSEHIAYFFEDFEWTTGMFKSSNDEELYIIEDMLELRKNNNCVVVLTISDAQMLKRYNINTEAKNVEMLGSPSVDEIWRTYIRRYFRLYRKRRAFGIEQFTELRLIAESVGSGDKTLKEAIRIFDRIMKANKGKIDKEDFNSAIDKIIEEKVILDDVVLSDDIKHEIVERVDAFLSADDVSKVTKGMILTGPPGTGKTFMVKALANEKNCYFMSPSLADLKGEYVGHTSAKVKRLFQQARANAPTIMFIDEADTVFQMRDSSAGDSDSFTKDMVNQFLVEMDGLCVGGSKVFVIAATNRIATLDNAIKSRLGTPIEIGLPDKIQRKQLFADHLRKKNVERFIKFGFFDGFIDKTNRMSGRDIKNFVSSLDTEAKKKTKRLEQFTDETETRELFYNTLKGCERDLINKLQSELNLVIRYPSAELGYDSIIGCKNVKDIIDKQLRTFDAAERKKAKEYNIKPSRGILLYGPPGNGKSQMAAAAASEKGMLFMKVTSDIFTKATLNEKNQVLIRIFNSAIQLSELCSEQNGVLLFFDEFDALAATPLLDNRIRGTLLTQLDDPYTMRNPSTKVLLVAATNHPDILDDAVARRGRIDERVEMKNPNKDEARLMIQSFCQRNSRVEIPDDTLADTLYSKYIIAAENQRIDDYIQENREIWIDDGKKVEELKRKAQTLFNDQMHPSGADLQTYVDCMIEHAYDISSFSESGMLRITPEISDWVCNTMIGAVNTDNA